jgi:hypothetical protein
MSKSIAFVKYNARAKGVVSQDSPADYASTILDKRGNWRFPALQAVIETPTLRADGNILETSGYNEFSGLHYLPSAEFPRIPENPSKDDAIKVLAEIKDIFSEFPFVDDAARSVPYAAVLTARVRCMTTFPARLGDALCMVLTSSRMQDRKLGLNDDTAVLSAPTCSTFLGTGNNIIIRGDLTTRALVSRIGARMEFPGERKFKQPNLIGHVAEHRPKLVTAALTIMRAYVVAGR